MRIIAGMVLCLAVLFPAVSAVPADTGTDFAVGALLPLSGESATHGISARAALEIAQSDINEYLARMGRDMRVAVEIRDTRSDPDTAP